jgi:hypothetical protein
MNIVKCPLCGTAVALMADGACPACRRVVSTLVVPNSSTPDDAPSARVDLLLATDDPFARSPGETGVPTGLKVLATIQLFFIAAFAFVCLRMLTSPSINAAVHAETGPTWSVYQILSPLITYTLMGLSAYGYLERSRVLGYWCGNALAVGSILNILAFNASEGFARFPLHVPSLVYPVVLFCLLNTRYRNVFR